MSNASIDYVTQRRGKSKKVYSDPEALLIAKKKEKKCKNIEILHLKALQ